MNTFYWLVEGALAGCSRPGGPDGTGEVGRAQPRLAGLPNPIEEDLSWLEQQGIGALLSLTESALPTDLLAQSHLETLHLPVPDLHPPTPEGLMGALGFIDQQRAHGRSVAVHCLVGEGRTGTVLAAYLIREGHTPEEALARLRAIRSGAVSSPEQEMALRAFAARRDWII